MWVSSKHTFFQQPKTHINMYNKNCVNPFVNCMYCKFPRKWFLILIRQFHSKGFNLVFTKKVRRQKHPWDVCNNRHISVAYLQYINHFILSKYGQRPVQENPMSPPFRLPQLVVWYSWEIDLNVYTRRGMLAVWCPRLQGSAKQPKWIRKPRRQHYRLLFTATLITSPWTQQEVILETNQ